MPHHAETRHLPYTPEQLFDLVVAIDRYPEFLPWCKAARIIERTATTITADLIIGAGPFTEKFTSLVILTRPRRITVSYKSGPLSRLTNEWQFKPAGKHGCDLQFEVDFDFRSPLLRSAMGLFFDKALKRMAAAFEERAAAVYG